MVINLKPREQCRWDAAPFGEVMLRLDPSEGRIKTTRTLPG
jgi:2-dehydro-3-deoxygluconokinase